MFTRLPLWMCWFSTAALISLFSYHAAAQATFENFTENPATLKAKKGKVGLVQKRKVLVPYHYTMVLPTLDAPYVFIALDSMLGIYDINRKQEIFTSKKGVKRLDITLESDSILNLFVQNSDDQYDVSIYQYYNNTNAIKEVERDAVNVLSPADSYYGNGIELYQDSLYIHHHTWINWKENEDEGNYEYLKTRQQSGVISASTMEFILPPIYMSIEDASPRKSTNNILVNLKEVEVFAGPDSLTDGWVSRHPYDRPEKNVLTGYYNAKLEQILDFRKDQSIRVVDGGGFYNAVSYRQRDESELKVFNKHGKVLLKVPYPEGGVENVIKIPGYILVEAATDEMDFLEMTIGEYFIYNEDNKLLDRKKMRVVEWLNDEGTAIVSVLDNPAEYSTKRGLYDFTKQKYVLQPEYDKLTRTWFKDELSKCQSGLCTYYLKVTKGDSVIFYDQTLHPFKHETVCSVIPGPQPYEDPESWSNPLNFYYEVEVLNDKDDILIPFKDAGMKMEYGILRALDGYLDFPEIFAKTSDTYENLAILEVYETPDSKTTYGLLDKNDMYSMLLPPYFDKLSFDKDKKLLVFKYKNEEGTVLLERYFYK